MKKNYKFSETIFSLVIATGLFFFLSQLAVAASSLPLPEVGNYNGMVQDPGIKDGSSFQSNFASLIVGIVLNVRYLLLAVAIAMMTYAGFRMVTAQGNEESWKNAKSVLVYSIIGFALVGLAGEIVRIFAVGECAELGMLPSSNNASCAKGGFLANPQAIIQRSTLFNKNVQYIITFIKYLVGSVAVVMIMRNALRMVSNSAGDELAKDKKNLIATSIGLIAIIIADPLINNVFFAVDKTRYPGVGGTVVAINYKQGISEIAGFTNFLVTILTPIAVLVILAGGVMYMTAAGNSEAQQKAKRMITLALVALLVIYGAFAIVSTFISGQFNVGAPTTNPAAAIEGIATPTTSTPPPIP